MRQRLRILSAVLAPLLLVGCGEMGDSNVGEKTGPGDGPVEAETGSPGPSGVPATSPGNTVEGDSTMRTHSPGT